MQVSLLSTLNHTRPRGFDRTAVIIAAYNEARFIGSVVIRARRYASTVVVVDDGSQDGTPSVAEAAGAFVIRHPVNLGKGAALKSGFQYVRGLEGPQVIVTIDGDGQHNCSEIPDVARPILEGRADLVVGSRFLDKKSETPRWRIFGQQALTIATNVTARSSLTDSQSGFRAFSRKVLDLFPFDTDGFSVESEMQFVIQNAGLRVSEVPISVVYKEPSKRNPILHGLQVLNGIVHLVSRYRPLFFFGGGGLAILLIGLAWGAYVVDIYRRSSTLAVGYALISVLLTIIGASSLFTGLMLNAVIGLMNDIKKTVDRSQK